MLIAQITDMHVRASGRLAYGAVDTAAHLADCVRHLNALDPAPDVVLATGDLVHAGADDEYQALRSLLDPLRAPLHLIPGNHDHRARLLGAFEHHDYLPRDEAFIHYSVEHHPLRLVGLDSTIEGEHGGTLCDERLGWLDRCLAAAPDRPTMLFIHHPPFATGIRFMDGYGFGEAAAAAFGEVLGRHPQVIRLVCGHIHRSIQTTWHGVSASVAPSPAHAVALDLGPEPRLAVRREPRAYHLHVWNGGRDVVTHVSHVDEFEVVYSGPS